MKSNVIAYGIGVGTLCMSMAAAFAQTATTQPAPAQPGSMADRVAQSAAPSYSGAPSMTPQAGELGSAIQGAGNTTVTGVLPAPQQSGGATYITGGFGEDQAKAFREAGAKYSVVMVFSEAKGAYLADIPVQIKAKGGGANVDIPAAGPYLLVDLPNGNYTAQATYQGKIHTRNFRVSGQKGQRLSFTW